MSEYALERLADARDARQQRVDALTGEIEYLAAQCLRDDFAGPSRRVLGDKILERLCLVEIVNAHDIAVQQANEHAAELARQAEAQRPARERAAHIDATLKRLLSLNERLSKLLNRIEFNARYAQPPTKEELAQLRAFVVEWKDTTHEDFCAARRIAGRRWYLLDAIPGFVNKAADILINTKGTK